MCLRAELYSWDCPVACWGCHICSNIPKIESFIFQMCFLSAWDILQGIGDCWKGRSSPRGIHILGRWSQDHTVEDDKRDSCNECPPPHCFILFCMSLVKCALFVCLFVPCLSPSCLNKYSSPKFKFSLSAFWLASLDLLCELSDQTSV